MQKSIVYENTDGVFIVQFNRPKYGNKINSEMLEAFADICDEITAAESSKAVIITGRGDKAFCTGSEKTDLTTFYGKTISAMIGQLRPPVIAAINGDAFGEGLELALACDIRIAASQARFSLPQVKTGRLPAEGGTQRLPRIVGLTKATELILTGEVIDAQEALRIGLVSSIIQANELLSCVKNMAKTMAGKSSVALNYAKEAINKGLELTLEQGLRLEADLYFLLHTTEDRTEGIKAFREKRKPEFKGR